MAEKRRALVTGGSGVIGSSIAKALASKGHHVYVHGNSSLERANAVVEEIKKSGGSAESIQFDVANHASCQEMLAKIAEDAPIQILVNNAGIHDDAPLIGMSEKQWNSVIDVSLNGFFNVTQPLLIPMMRSRWGRVISISSISGVIGNRGQINYSAAKGGLQAAMRSLSREYASRGITANVVAPGVIESPSTDKFTKESIAEKVPMKRMGKAEDVAELVKFLASEKANYISGQIIGVDGGMSG
ncbi:MAG: 3-oxoacyl-ACP reductase FabG [Alphaproteobacteria bacterium]